VQDYDGLIRIAPGTPSRWDFEGSVWVRDHTRVDVQVRAGVPTTVAIEAGATSTLHIRNPWPGQPVEVMDALGKSVLKSADPVFELPVRKGEAYLLVRVNAGGATLAFAPITGTPALHLKKLGGVQLGK
jgi:hypothetical protein